jgi:threonylcarbamoyladenosine tRNA methylthiotransferase MtaB
VTERFSLHTSGCRLNQYEIEAIGAKLESLGFQEVPFDEPVDVAVINTCTVTGRADADARNAIRRARRTSPGGRVVVTGCYAQAQPEEIEGLGAVDLVVDNTDKERLVAKMVGAFGYALPGGIDFQRMNTDSFELGAYRRHTRAMVKVQDGCQEGCTYCIIPRARGHERSRSPESILREVKLLESNGYKEVILTGVHVGKYRYDNWRLVDLLRALLTESGVEQIRLTSMEPREFRPALVDVLLNEDRCCAHLHIPLQSGHDVILRAMRRSYDTAYVRDLFNTLVKGRPDLAIGTDVIAGFPGETESHFAGTAAFLKSQPLAYLHVFSYSDRPGTAASVLPHKVSSDVIKARTVSLRELSRVKRMAFLSRFIHHTLPVLVEQHRDRQTGLLVGRSGNYMRVLADGPDSLMNTIVPMRIVRFENESAIAVAA